MKGFALVLLCAVAASQARSTGVEIGREAASLGENPWLVHLRLAVTNSGGLLNSCIGSLVDPRWVLTSASCVNSVNFVWIRYGAVDVFTPELVTEGGAAAGHLVQRHPQYDPVTGANDIALIRVNRYVLNPPSANIAVVELAAADAEVPSSGKVCTYGADADGAAGEFLSCVDADVSTDDDGVISADAESTIFDLGSPLVKDGMQYGILTRAGDSSSFINPAAYRDWIEQTAEIQLPGGNDSGDSDDNGDDSDDNGDDSDDNGDDSDDNGDDSDDNGDDSNDSDDSEDSEGLKINFVN
ncbi:chymotrypsin BII-like [Ostrinia nubilalis]|uniref:chymotrypsin BII-like n=1 Tax=Ostrinia nubilalis TaxID=29057 RepID=UPI0030825369